MDGKAPFGKATPVAIPTCLLSFTKTSPSTGESTVFPLNLVDGSPIGSDDLVVLCGCDVSCSAVAASGAGLIHFDANGKMFTVRRSRNEVPWTTETVLASF